MANPAALKVGQRDGVRFDPTLVGDLDVRRARFVRDLFEAHYERVYCFLSRRIGAEQAEDLAQEVFFRLLKHRSLETVEVSRSYLFKIADNLVKNSARRDSRRKALAIRLREVIQSRDHGNSGGSRGVVLEAGSLDNAMSVLTANERSAITLIVCRGLSYEAASIALGVSVTTINNWKHRGVKKLREHTQADARRESQTGESGTSGESRAGSSEHPAGSRHEQAPGTSEARSATEGGRHARLRFGRVG